MSDKKLKVLLLNTQMEAAGAQKAMLVLAGCLQAKGHTVQVVTMYDKASFVVPFSKQYGVDIVDLQMKRPDVHSPITKAFYAVDGLQRLYQLMRRERYDVIQTFSHYSNVIGPIVAWLAGVRVRVSSQRMSLKGSPNWLLMLDRLVTNSSLVSAMVSVSEGTRQFSIKRQGIKPEKLITIHNSIDIERFVPLPQDTIAPLRHELGVLDDTKVILTVARLHPQKGHRFLLEAMPKIVQKHPQCRFLFVGEGELRNVLEAMAQTLGVQDVVHFLGVRQDIPELLNLSDIFVLPSLWEGLPNSVLEAMATETAVVATNVDGSPEVIQDGKTGFLVLPESAEALEEAIIHLLDDEQLCQEMGRAGRVRVIRDFSEEKNVTSFLNLYKQLLQA